MSSINNFSQLLSEKKWEQAILFCEKMIAEYPKFSFYHFWLNKLKNENNSIINSTELPIEGIAKN